MPLKRQKMKLLVKSKKNLRKKSARSRKENETIEITTETIIRGITIEIETSATTPIKRMRELL